MAGNPHRNIQLYRWSRFLRSLIFWQAIWFLYFQEVLSAAEAILLYAVYDVATTLLEVPSGYLSDRIGRRLTLLASALTGLSAATLLYFGNSFAIFAIANCLLGASAAFASGTDEAMLYESLAATDRAHEVEAQEVIAWRYSFTALALSALAGGALALINMKLAYLGVVFSYLGLFIVTALMVEPPRTTTRAEGSELLRWRGMLAYFRDPVLLWFFALMVLLYGFGHFPFVFGQPFILNAMEQLGLANSTPLISGMVTASMMAISVGVSLFAVQLRKALGLPCLLLGAFTLQVIICAAMALTDSAWVVAILLLRMVPSALTRPFILGRVQPLLSDDSRATWLSMQSFLGRLAFASALTLGAISTTDVGQMTHPEISAILTVATLIGFASFTALALAARLIPVEAPEAASR